MALGMAKYGERLSISMIALKEEEEDEEKQWTWFTCYMLSYLYVPH